MFGSSRIIKKKSIYMKTNPKTFFKLSTYIIPINKINKMCNFGSSRKVRLSHFTDKYTKKSRSYFFLVPWRAQESFYQLCLGSAVRLICEKECAIYFIL